MAIFFTSMCAAASLVLACKTVGSNTGAGSDQRPEGQQRQPLGEQDPAKQLLGDITAMAERYKALRNTPRANRGSAFTSMRADIDLLQRAAVMQDRRLVQSLRAVALGCAGAFGEVLPREAMSAIWSILRDIDYFMAIAEDWEANPALAVEALVVIAGHPDVAPQPRIQRIADAVRSSTMSHPERLLFWCAAAGSVLSLKATVDKVDSVEGKVELLLPYAAHMRKPGKQGLDSASVRCDPFLVYARDALMILARSNPREVAETLWKATYEALFVALDGADPQSAEEAQRRATVPATKDYLVSLMGPQLAVAWEELKGMHAKDKR